MVMKILAGEALPWSGTKEEAARRKYVGNLEGG